jgi:nucleoredoxin
MSFEAVNPRAKDEKSAPAAPASPPVWELLTAPNRDFLVTNGGKRVPIDFLKGKIVGLYFSAHWCPPCRAFTPVAAGVYQQLRNSGKDFEMVYISSDRNEHQFTEYFAEHPWLAVPFADKATKGALADRFGVSGIPCLILFDTNGQFLTDNGREAIGVGGAAAYPFEKYKGQASNAASGAQGLQRIILLVVGIWFVWSFFNKAK